MINEPIDNDARTLAIQGSHGRDLGKVFHLCEIDPLTLSGYVLRLVAALRVKSYDSLLETVSGEPGAPPSIDIVMQILQGADPAAIHSLITELLDYVKITPDPKHPGAQRALISNDIREIRTLGDILMGVARLNFQFGG